jgi:hypothetical protein
MKEIIIDCMAQSGWLKDKIVDAFGKTFETAVVPKRASIWLHFWKESNRWWLMNGDFTSAGENVLAAEHAIFTAGMTREEIEPVVSAFVAQLERRIAGAWSVRLMH